MRSSAFTAKAMPHSRQWDASILKGYVDVDINRGKNLPAKMTAKLDSGQYVLVDSVGTVYQLDDRASAQKFTGNKVKIS